MVTVIAPVWRRSGSRRYSFSPWSTPSQRSPRGQVVE
jgi:hypothetical protein